MNDLFDSLIKGIRAIQGEGNVPLHRFNATGNELTYIAKALEEGNVTTSGTMVNEVEQKIASYLNANHAVATTSGTSALHLALHSLGCDSDCEVITQSFSFVATANAIIYTEASPIFLDCDSDCLGLSPAALEQFLTENVILKGEQAFNKITGKRIIACVPVHIFGLPAKMKEIVEICDRYHIKIVEDAAQAFGASLFGKALGTWGDIGIFSFNGSKVVTAGMGGVAVTNSDSLANLMLHLSTNAKVANGESYSHDQVGFNYRMANLNAALLISQCSQIDEVLGAKERMALRYSALQDKLSVDSLSAIEGAKSSFWLNHILLPSESDVQEFVAKSKQENIDCRVAWPLLCDLPFCKKYYSDGAQNARSLQKRIVLLPSGLS